MTLEQKLFIDVLTDHLHERKTEAVAGVNWDTVFDIAFLHRMTSIVYYQCKSIIPQEKIGKYRTVFYVSLAAYQKREELFEKIKTSFEENKIEFAIVKGPFAAKYYPVKELREMGDLDVIAKNTNKAEKALFSFGMKKIPNKGTYEEEYEYNGLEIELRDALVQKGAVIGEDRFEDYFQGIWSFVKDGELDENFHFLVLIRHLRKHMANGGVGFRLFYDLAVQIKNNKNLDWDYLEKTIKDLGLEKFAANCFAFIDKWFGIKAPILAVTLDEGFYKESTSVVFENGIFGFGNIDNKGAFELNQVMSEKHPKLTMVKNAASLAFPPYKALCKKYKFVNGRPYLTPVAWIYRFFDSASKGKGAKGVKDLGDQFFSSEEIAKRKDSYEKWGL